MKTPTKLLHHAPDLVQLRGTDVRAVREAEVHQAPLAQQIRLGEGRARVRRQREGPADVRAADGARLERGFCEGGRFVSVKKVRGIVGRGGEGGRTAAGEELRLFVAEVDEEADARGDEQRRCPRREYL